jgi:putative transcriptional regulator
MRQLMEQKKISFYRLANEGIDAQTLQRIRHDKPVTTETLGRLCEIMECQPGDLIEYLRADTSESNKQNCQG